MHIFKFLLLFPVMAGSALTFASPADNPTATQIQPEKIAVSSAHAPMATAKADSEQYRREKGYKIAEAKQKAEANAAKEAEAKTIASSSQREIQQKIFRSWQVPEGSAGLDARARIVLTDAGNVQSIVVMDAPNAAFKNSIEKAVRQAAPFAMPEDRDARRAARLIHIRFTAK